MYNRAMADDQGQPVAAILDAAVESYLQRGIEKTSMADVANAAGVARSTLYRYFPGRDDLLIAAVHREMLELGDKMHRRLARFPAPADHIVEGLVLALQEIPRRPLLYAVFASDDVSRARRVVWNSPLIVQLGNQFMGDVIAPALQQGALKDSAAPEVLIEWVYRILLSFLTLPSNFVKTRSQLRATLHALLIPVLLR